MLKINIEFHNVVSGDQFRVILCRPVLKSSKKSSEEIVSKSTEKIEGSEKFALKSTEKSTEKTEVLIVRIISGNKNVTINMLSKELAISERAVSKQLKKLQQSGKIRRVGPDKGGHWEICE